MLTPAPTDSVTTTAVYIDWPNIADPREAVGAPPTAGPSKPSGKGRGTKQPATRDFASEKTYPAFVGQVSDPANPFPDVREGEWNAKFDALFDLWQKPLTFELLKQLPPQPVLIVTRGGADRVTIFRKAFDAIAEHAAEPGYLRSQGSLAPIDWLGGDAPYALAYLVLSAKLRRVYTQVVGAAADPKGKRLGDIVQEKYEQTSGEGNAISPGNLILYLLDTKGVDSITVDPPPKGGFDLCLAVDYLDRVDERIFRSLVSLLASGGGEDIGMKGARPKSRHAALSELGFSGLPHGLDRWLDKYPRISPLNTFDSAITSSGSAELIKSHFGSILPRLDGSKGPVPPTDLDGEVEKLKYILSIATGVANFQIEGRPSYFTLLLTKEPIKDPPIENLTELFRYAPGIPLQYRNKRLRSAIESSPSPNFVLCASLRTMRVERCFSYCAAAGDVFRRQHFSDKIARFHGVVVHTHQSGSVEVYNHNGLCLLGHGIQWFVEPYEKLHERCKKFFIGGDDFGAGALAWRVCGIVANLVEQRASSIMLFAKKKTIKLLAAEGVLTNMQASALEVNEADEVDEAKGGLCVKSKFYFEDVCRFLQIDGAHAVSRTGDIIRFGLKIKDPSSDNKLGGTGKSATKAIAQAICNIEGEGSTSFVVKVSGSGHYSLFQHGQQVLTPFDE